MIINKNEKATVSKKDDDKPKGKQK